MACESVIKSLVGEVATATTGAVILPVGMVDAEEPSCSMRHTGDWLEEVPTISEPSAVSYTHLTLPTILRV